MRVPKPRPVLVARLILGLILVVPGIQAQDASRTVYATKTGAKYHSLGCQYLRRSSIPKSLDEALKSGLTACSRCRPPQGRSGGTSAAMRVESAGWRQGWGAVREAVREMREGGL